MTSPEQFTALGDEGILALVCDSTNVVREGFSPSETEVAATLKTIIADAPHRVAVTTFASNVARIRAVAEAAQACGREVIAVGRAMDRVIDVARECGYLDGLPEFRRRIRGRASPATRSWPCSPARRARTGPRSPASPAATIRISPWPRVTA